MAEKTVRLDFRPQNNPNSEPYQEQFELLHGVYSTRLYGCNRNVTVTVVSASTGCPLRRYGLYRHCLTASIAAVASIGCPLTS